MKYTTALLTAALLPLAATAQEQPAPAEAPAAPAAAEQPAAPVAADETVSDEEFEAAVDAARQIMQDHVALFTEMRDIVDSDRNIEEKVAAIRALKSRAAELGKAMAALDERAMNAAMERIPEPELPALEQAMNTPELADAIFEVIFAMQDEMLPREDEAELPTVENSPAVQEASEFMMHYFQNPQPDKIDNLIGRWAELFPSIGQCNAVPASLIFFAEVFKANPGLVEGWMATAAKLPEDWQAFFKEALKHARGEEKDVTTLGFASPELLDACWGGFMGSGDRKYPEFVLSVACQDEDEDTVDMTVRAAAWSCASFILNYPEMKEIARAWFAQASEQQRQNFAARVNEEVQRAVFDTVLHAQE